VYDSTSMRAKLDGCDAWLCFNCESGKLKQQLDVAVAAGIKRLVITSTLPAEEVVSMGLKGMLEVRYALCLDNLCNLHNGLAFSLALADASSPY
jgi:hypothetical protein